MIHAYFANYTKEMRGIKMTAKNDNMNDSTNDSIDDSINDSMNDNVIVNDSRNKYMNNNELL